MIQNETTRKVIFITLAVLCLTPLITPPVALLLGLLVAQFVGHPYLKQNKKYTTMLLQISVVGLGFGMNLHSAMEAGKQGISFTIASIIGTLLLGALLGYWLKIDKKTSHLISSGTAICGGSAIAAVSPVIHAEEEQISVALGIVFILNSIALLIFPPIGHALGLTQKEFGMWAAIAIHDTSSVVGAAKVYGQEALEVATTVKLTRALWIIPLALGTALVYKDNTKKIKIPYFIGYFIIAMAINTYVPAIHPVSPFIVQAAKAGLTLTLFLIGAGLSKKTIRSVGVRPFIQGIILWVVISSTALWAVLSLVD
ncbi:YeiH family protein [Polluticoccus soli]|uniref:YeiH family protein n=1 Tax=Polluticoccus soli TaxID=3034150 RepID=UPI0023E2545C|nr:putative sulfate exporter family transporter [Flavipsychrobacter sp. JY13-12]